MERVFDLPAVPVARLFAFIVNPVSLGKLEDLVLGKVNFEAGVSKSQEATLPDLQGGCLGELRVVEADVNTRSECFVEFADAIGGQNNDPREIFEDSEEDYRNSVSVSDSSL